MLKLLANYLFLPFLALGFVFLFEMKYDLVGLTFIMLIAQSVLFLSLTFTRNVNLLVIYFTFTLVFLSIIPWLHYSSNHYIWRSSKIADSIYLIVNVLIFLANTVIFFTYSFNSKMIQGANEYVVYEKNKKSAVTLLAFSCLSFLFLLYLNDFSITQLLFRGLVDEYRVVVVESSSLSLLLGMASRLTPVFCFFYAATQIKRKAITKFLLLLIMILSVFPTGVARYMVAFVYIPLLLLYIPMMRRASVFAGILIFSLFFVFPFLDQFRYFSGFDNLKILPPVEFFYAAHFDAYENFASAVESNFVTYGYQLLGSLFFFIPRVFWPGKPVGSGYEMAENNGYSFNNISMPFLGEGYVNFGVAGVLIFSVLIGYFMAKTDSRFAAKNDARIKPNYFSAVYYFLIGALFFLLRGDLLSSFAYISAGLIVALFIAKLMRLVNSVNSVFFRL